MQEEAKLTTLSPCQDCPAKCCHNLSIWIGAPKTKEQIDDLMWEVRFNTVRIYIRNRRWYLLIDGKCMYLDKNYRCKIYGTHPEKCIRHTPPNCERFGSFWDVMINTPEELEAYLAKRRKKTKAPRSQDSK
jgi:Fe-S-cluster containining protein